MVRKRGWGNQESHGTEGIEDIQRLIVHSVSQLTQSSLGISQILQAKTTPLLFLHFTLNYSVGLCSEEPGVWFPVKAMYELQIQYLAPVGRKCHKYKTSSIYLLLVSSYILLHGLSHNSSFIICPLNLSPWDIKTSESLPLTFVLSL